MRTSIPRTIAATFAGIATACLLAELLLRPLATAWHERPATGDYTIRQYYEGFATAHFRRDVERLTGNPPLAGGANLLLLGDSHVEALQVEDTETMGSVLERQLRAAGRPVNVHQYGWSSADLAYYLRVAPRLAAQYQPQTVVIIVNPADLPHVGEALPAAVAPLVNDRPLPGPPGFRQALAAAALKRSVLVYHLYRATAQMEEAARLDAATAPYVEVPPAPLDLPALTSTLAALKQTYGDGLLLVYDGFLDGLHVSAQPDDIEAQFLRICEEQRMHCVTTRAALARDRFERQRISRGFLNSAPGEGHWNAVGHGILAQTIDQALQATPGKR